MVRLGASIHAERVADPPLAARFVDVPVDPEDRPEGLDRRADPRRPDRAPHQVAGRHLRPEIRRQEWRRVEARVVRRDVGHHHRLPRVANILEQGRKPVEELLLGEFARRVPRRRRGPPHADQLMPRRQVDDLLIDVSTVGRGIEQWIDVAVVIIPGHQIDRHAGAIEPIGSQRHPLLDPTGDPLIEVPAHDRWVRFHLRPFVGRDADCVVAEVGDRALERDQLLLAPGHTPLAEHVRRPGLAAFLAPDDRDERLAGQVAGDQRCVDLVDVCTHRVQKLAPRALGGVEIAADVDAERPGHRQDAIVRRPPSRPNRARGSAVGGLPRDGQLRAGRRDSGAGPPRPSDR